MITRVQVLNFRSLRWVDQSLDSLHVLVGPNASGKTTFLDVVGFLSCLVSEPLEGLDKAIGERTRNFQDLVWQREGDCFELAIEAAIPEERRMKLPHEAQHLSTIRYEIAVRFNSDTNEAELSAERVLLQTNISSVLTEGDTPTTLLTSRDKQLDKDHLVVVHKQNLSFVYKLDGEYDYESGFDWIESETFPHRDDEYVGRKRQSFPFKIGSRRSSLANIPTDEYFFPVTTWFKELLTNGVQLLALNGTALRAASPPGQGRGFASDGSNLPWVVDNLKKKSPKRFRDWISHLRTGLPDLQDIRVVQRADDKHRYLIVRYASGVEVPSWMVSDGTLRLLALTLPAYLTDFRGVYLIEEPENGIHPRAVETMFQSLSSIYDAQILLATHSPVVLSIVDAKQVLCFSKDTVGATHIVRGDQHPALQHWHGETNLGTLFASGVLG